MKDFKFRAWDNMNKKWGLGYEYQNLGGFSMKGEVMCFGEYSRTLNSFPIEKWDELILMQSSGLFDKNGAEVYEDDILKSSNGDLMRVWQEPGVWLCGDVNKRSDDYLSKTAIDEMEVIGNIYETPELTTQP